MDGFATSHMMSEVLHARAGTAARVPRRPGRPHQVPRPSRRRCSSAPRAACSSCRRASRGTPRRLRGRATSPTLRRLPRRERPTPIESDNDGRAGPADARVGAGGTARPVAPPVASTRRRRARASASPRSSTSTTPASPAAVQNQPDFQAGSVDHRTHFAAEVPRFVRAGDAASTPRSPAATTRPCRPTSATTPTSSSSGSARSPTTPQPCCRTCARRASRSASSRSSCCSPSPRPNSLRRSTARRRSRCSSAPTTTALTSFVTQALFQGVENAARHPPPGHPGAARTAEAHHRDLRPRRARPAAAPPRRRVHATWRRATCPFVYLGTQFFAKHPPPQLAALQDAAAAAYPETELMALETEPNPALLPPEALRVRFHSVGGYGTIATGKLLTDILAGVLGMHSQVGAQVRLGEVRRADELLHHAEPRAGLAHQRRARGRRDRHLARPPGVRPHQPAARAWSTAARFILQSSLSPLEVWKELPEHARRTLRAKEIKFFVLDAFAVAKRHAPTPELETRMMGIAFIGAVCGHVDRIAARRLRKTRCSTKIRSQIAKKFGAQGRSRRRGQHGGDPRRPRGDAAASTTTRPEFVAVDSAAAGAAAAQRRDLGRRCAGVGGASAPTAASSTATTTSEMIAAPFREGTIAEAPVLPGTGLFMPAGTARLEGQGPVPARRAGVPRRALHRLHGVRAGLPGRRDPEHGPRHPRPAAHRASASSTCPSRQKAELLAHVHPLTEAVRARYKATRAGHGVPRDRGRRGDEPRRRDAERASQSSAAARRGAAAFPVARTRPFFDAPEKEVPGSGGLYSAAIDPWKCTGCLECIDVCGPRRAAAARAGRRRCSTTLQARFEFLSRTANTPARFVEGAVTPGRRHQADDARPRQLLRDHRRPRRLPRLRRGHRHPAGHVDEPRDPATGAARSTSRSSSG